MTCEIDIDTSRVWQAGEYLLVGRRANFDALWNDINRLDAALNSLRGFNNSSGSVVAHVERSQQYLNRCKTHCIEPTTNAMVRTAQFLQNVAVQYENTERAVASLWGSVRPWYQDLSIEEVGSILFQVGKIATKTACDHIADFVGQCWENALNYINQDKLGFVLDCIVIIGGVSLIATGVGAPLGIAILAVDVIPSVYSIFSGGGDFWNDVTVGLLTPVIGVENAQIAGKVMSVGGAVASLVLPGAAGAKTLYKGAREIQRGAEGGVNFVNAAKQFVTEKRVAYEAASNVHGMSNSTYLATRYLSAYGSGEVSKVGEIIKNPVVKGTSNYIQKFHPNTDAGKIVQEVDKNPIERIIQSVTGRTRSVNGSAVSHEGDAVNSFTRGNETFTNLYDNVDAFHNIEGDMETIIDEFKTQTDQDNE